METEVKNDYIAKALNELILVLGTKDYIDHQKLISLIHSKKIKETIKTIASHLGLPVEINLSYVPKGYRPSSNDGFHSTHLVKTDWRGKGASSITAQVSIPSNLPIYGTREMVNFPISVRLSANCAENPATLITVMAHELSHILLYSLLHKEKENEFYTDLTAMMLGFANIMKMGRKIVKTSTSTKFFSSTTTTHTETTTYGYLSDKNFNFALKKIESVLNIQEECEFNLLAPVGPLSTPRSATDVLRHLIAGMATLLMPGRAMEYPSIPRTLRDRGMRLLCRRIHQSSPERSILTIRPSDDREG